MPRLPLEKWEADTPLCRRHSWWQKGAPGKCSFGAQSPEKAWTPKPMVSTRAASNPLMSGEVWGTSQVSWDLRPPTPTLLYSGEETEAQSRGVICPRSHTWQGPWGRRILNKESATQAKKSFPGYHGAPASKTLSSEQVMGPIHNPGPPTPQQGARKVVLA